MQLPPDIPPEAVEFLQEIGYLDPDRLHTGDRVPQITLRSLASDESVTLGLSQAALPTVLLFGSYTRPPFRRQAGRLEALYQTYRDRAAFYLVYIREAHPTDGWQLDSNRLEHVEYAQPQTFLQRREIADACVVGLNLSMPALVDAIDNRTDIAFNAWPERLYVVSTDARIVYQGGKGPYGFDVEELDHFLTDYLSIHRA